MPGSARPGRAVPAPGCAGVLQPFVLARLREGLLGVLLQGGFTGWDAEVGRSCRSAWCIRFWAWLHGTCVGKMQKWQVGGVSALCCAQSILEQGEVPVRWSELRQHLPRQEDVQPSGTRSRSARGRKGPWSCRSFVGRVSMEDPEPVPLHMPWDGCSTDLGQKYWPQQCLALRGACRLPERYWGRGEAAGFG